VVAVAADRHELAVGAVDLLDVVLAVEVGVALDLDDAAGLGIVDRRVVELAVVVEVGLLERRVAPLVVADDPVLAAVVVEVDLLAGQGLDLGAALVDRLVQAPDVGPAVAVEVVGHDVLAGGVAEGRIDLGHGGRAAARGLGGHGARVLALAAGDRRRAREEGDDEPRDAAETRTIPHASERTRSPCPPQAGRRGDASWITRPCAGAQRTRLIRA